MNSANCDWRGLLRLAFLFLDSGKIPQDRWTVGGGTVLMLHSYTETEQYSGESGEIDFIVAPNLC